MNLGMPEMIFIFLLALIIFGPKKLPEIGAQFGKALSEFKRASNEFKSQLEEEVRNLERQTTAPPPPEPAILPPAGTIAHSASSPETVTSFDTAGEDSLAGTSESSDPHTETSFSAAAGADPASSELIQGSNG
jgi:TatA/E family protein of Tat protein translocase